MANHPVTSGICVTGITGCAPYDCTAHGTCESVEVERDQGFAHNISTDYILNACGVQIPIVRTRRTLNVNWHVHRDDPRITNAYVDADNELARLYCQEPDPDIRTATFSENCVIEKSTVHYLDQRYGVCLYRCTTESLVINSIQRNNEEVFFQSGGGDGYFHRIKVMSGDFTQNSRTEWRLVVDGVETVIDAAEVDPQFIGPAFDPDGGASLWFPNYKRGPGIHMVLVFPWPGSTLGLPQSDLECGTPWYDASDEATAEADGGKDLFYPEWCRAMQDDPIWQEAAARRWQAKWYHAPEAKNRAWNPPPITVDPIPRGSFVLHPELGEVWQFLTDMRGNHTTMPDRPPKISQSPNFTPEISRSVPEGQMGASTLYYPISLL